MLPVPLDLIIFAGLDFGPVSITCRQSKDGPVFDLTGWQAFAEVRKTVGSAVIVDLSPTIPTPTDGIVVLQLTRAQTAALAVGGYQWDLVLQDADGKARRPFVAGKITIAKAVTQLA